MALVFRSLRTGEVPLGSTVALTGDVDRRSGVFGRMAQMLVDPRSCLVLDAERSHSTQDRVDLPTEATGLLGR